MPGLVDSHAHILGHAQAPSAEYIVKLWLAHGVTTVRDVGCFAGLDFTLSEARRSEADEITAPDPRRRLLRDGIRRGDRSARRGGEVGAGDRREGRGRGEVLRRGPKVFEAALKEINTLGLDSACHHAQRRVSEINAMTTARWGLTALSTGTAFPRPCSATRPCRTNDDKNMGGRVTD